MSDDARFDPRFDPAFQPGFDGPLAVTPPTAPDVQVAPPQSAPLRPVPVPAAPASTPAVDARDDAEHPRGLNPFVIALAAAAAVFLGVGIALLSRLREIFSGADSLVGADYPTAMVLIYAAPLLIVLGLATGVGVLFLLAVRWDRR